MSLSEVLLIVVRGGKTEQAPDLSPMFFSGAYIVFAIYLIYAHLILKVSALVPAVMYRRPSVSLSVSRMLILNNIHFYANA